VKSVPASILYVTARPMLRPAATKLRNDRSDSPNLWTGGNNHAGLAKQAKWRPKARRAVRES
jgi:hypothetical protein